MMSEVIILGLVCNLRSLYHWPSRDFDLSVEIGTTVMIFCLTNGSVVSLTYALIVCNGSKSIWWFLQVWSVQRFCTFFLFNFFKMEFNPLLDLLNTGFTITETGLFLWNEHRKRKYADLQISLTRWQYLLNLETSCFAKIWKLFKY